MSQVLDRDGSGTVYVSDGAALCAGEGGIVDLVSLVVIEGEEASSWFGSEALWLDDVDADGIQELAVTAPSAAGGSTARGAVYFWFSVSDAGRVVASSADLVLSGTQDGAQLSSVVTAFDDAGPGVPWMILGQQLSVGGTSATFVVDARSAASGSVESAAHAGLVTWSEGRQMSAVNVGDTDFNGSDNLVVGAWMFGLWDVSELTGYIDEGDAAQEMTYETEGEWITSVVSTGDYDEDSRDDFALLAEDWPGFTEQGQLALVPAERTGGGSLEFTTMPLVAQGASAGDRFGYRALPVGDFDDDGIADLAVAAPGADLGAAGAGSVYLLPLP